ncbi:hypothetical protein JOF56_009839 [Kibdelosporangium banguiense]|uniref:Uncharacterized protein n=1 Tax=Kibdelosporangium banguiense TaxID=1365924 RepID=A0ABS4TZQ5_9PSEU|nr:hypothetical protein [Kibdelosporangium banguiense]MBP2329454.1 hypothetical protein [Kibdelosporangium banguiense]
MHTAIGDGVRHVLDGNPLDATKALASVGYTNHKRVHTATKRAFNEMSDSAAWPRGWAEPWWTPSLPST